MGNRWLRDIYRDAVWQSEGLKGLEKAVAEVYARHARDEHGKISATADMSWITYDRLMAMAGIGRRATISAIIAALVESGWLKPIQQVSRRATVYRLTIPLAGSSDGGTTGLPLVVPTVELPAGTGSSDGGTTDPSLVVPLPQPVVPTVELPNGSGSSTGGTQLLKELLKDQNLSQRAGADDNSAGPDATPRESSTSSDSKPQGGSAYVALAAEGVTGDEADRFIAWADERKGGDKGGGWYRTVASNGDLAGFVKKFRAEYRERCADHQSYYVESCPHHQCPEHLGTTQVGNCHECDYDYGNPAFWDGRSLLCPEHPNSYIYECRDCLQAHRDTGHHISRHRIDRQRTDWKPTPTFTAAAARSPRPSRKTHSDDDPWNN